MEKGLKTAHLATAGSSQILLLLEQADGSDLKLALLRFTKTDETYLRNLASVYLLDRQTLVVV